MPEWNIESQELSRIRANVVLVDVREPEELDEDGFIEGSRSIPLGEILSRAPRELDPEHDIVLYCAHGVRSVHALLALQKLGFEKSRSLDGGICAWIDQGLAISRRS